MQLYLKQVAPSSRFIEFMGIRLYSQEIGHSMRLKKIFFGLYTEKYTDKSKTRFLFGIKISENKRTVDALNEVGLGDMLREIRSIRREICIEQYKNHFLVISHHQKLFSPYKDIHKGGIGVIVGSGSTLKYYEKISNGKHFVVNAAIDYLEPDYWFSIDITNVKKVYKRLKMSNYPKFIGQALVDARYRNYRRFDTKEIAFIPDCIIEELKNSHKFYIDHPSKLISRDISCQPLPDLGSSIFSALSFAIYTGCKKIYIVGCDCASNGYFDGSKQRIEWLKGTVPEKLITSWKLYKEHIAIFHPDVELISVNPIGLRGVFRDVYTKMYLDANPDVRKKLGKEITLLTK